METPEQRHDPSIPDLPPDPHIMDYVVLVLRNRKIIFSILFLCVAAALGSTYIVPYTYQAEVLLLPPDRSSSASLLDALHAGGALKIMKEVENPSVDLLQNFLESRALALSLARDSAIYRYFASRTNGRDELASEIRQAIVVVPEVHQMTVRGVVSTNWLSNASEKKEAQYLSERLANLAVRAMDSMMKFELQDIAYRTMIFSDSDYHMRTAELDSIEDDLADFETTYGVPDIKTQTMQTVTQLGKLQAERDEASIRARLLERDLSSDDPRVRAARAKEQEADRMITSYSTEYRIGPSLAELPKVANDYLELVRRKEALEPIVKFLREETEQERINAERAQTPITVLDHATVPDRRIAPQRVAMMGLGLVIGVFTSILFLAVKALFSEGVRRVTMQESALA